MGARHPLEKNNHPCRYKGLRLWRAGLESVQDQDRYLQGKKISYFFTQILQVITASSLSFRKQKLYLRISVIEAA